MTSADERFVFKSMHVPRGNIFARAKQVYKREGLSVLHTTRFKNYDDVMGFHKKG